MANIKDIVQYAINKDGNRLKPALDEYLSDKIADRLNVAKVAVAQKLFTDTSDVPDQLDME